MAAGKTGLGAADTANVKTSIFEKVSYGMGDVACNVVFALTSGLVTYFYTNVMSVSAGLVGMIMLFSRLFDGLSDVAIGLIMDKVHSKYGRGRAWVLWMAIPYAVSAVLLFCLPRARPRPSRRSTFSSPTTSARPLCTRRSTCPTARWLRS